MTTATTSIAICVATYRRPEGLSRLLKSLQVLHLEGVATQLIVADNDPKGSGKETFDTWGPLLPFKYRYLVEPERGIVPVRNRLVAEARAIGAEFIAFTDDDATVDPFWLKNLMDQTIASEADAVAGTVISKFEIEPVPYIRSGYTRTPNQNGEPPKVFGTGNVLLRTSALKEIPGPFDYRFRFTGGSDAMLHAVLNKRGFKIVGSREAIVYETVPPTRVSIKWVLLRGYRSGVGSSRILMFNEASMTSIMKHIAKSFAQIVVGFLLLIGDTVANRHRAIVQARRVARGVGSIAALISGKLIYNEYKTTHSE